MLNRLLPAIRLKHSDYGSWSIQRRRCYSWPTFHSNQVTPSKVSTSLTEERSTLLHRTESRTLPTITQARGNGAPFCGTVNTLRSPLRLSSRPIINLVIVCRSLWAPLPLLVGDNVLSISNERMGRASDIVAPAPVIKYLNNSRSEIKAHCTPDGYSRYRWIPPAGEIH